MADRYVQIYAFLAYSVVLGFALGVVYDVFRIIRMMFCVPSLMISRELKGRERTGLLANTVVFVCDILFFLVSACICAIFIFHANHGRVRGIALFASLIGFIIYYNTVGRLITLVSGAVIRGIYYAVRFALKKILIPLFLFAIKPVGVVKEGFVKLFKKIRLPKFKPKRKNVKEKRIERKF